MVYYIIYNTTTGEIKRLISQLEEAGLDTVLANVDIGEDYLEAFADETTQYVQANAITSRPNLSDVATWSATSITTAETAVLGPSLPVGTVVQVTSNEDAQRAGAPGYNRLVVDDGSFEFASTIPGTYEVRVESFPYLVNTQTITVN